MLLDVNNDTWKANWGENVNIRMNSDVTLAIGNKNNSFLLFDVFDPGLGIRRKVADNGFWDSNSRNCSFISSMSMYERRRNMTGVVVRVAFLVTKNITISLKEHLSNRHTKNHDTIGKFNFELFENVIEEYNFT